MKKPELSHWLMSVIADRVVPSHVYDGKVGCDLKADEQTFTGSYHLSLSSCSISLPPLICSNTRSNPWPSYILQAQQKEKPEPYTSLSALPPLSGKVGAGLCFCP